MKRVWIILAVILFAAAILLPATVRQELGWIDSISGSQKRQTVWRFGAATSPTVSESLLAARYRKLGLRWEADWKNVKGTSVDIFGRSVGRSHGWPAPAIYSFALSADLQEWYLVASSDDDIRKFFRVMSSGTDAEKEAAVEAASSRTLGTYAATRPSR